MDPASVAGLIALAGHIANSIYKYGRGVRNARKDIDQLCIDLFALKGTLEHFRLHIESCKLLDDDVESSSEFTLTSQIFSTDEFNSMIFSTDSLLRDLYGMLEKTPDRRRNIVQHLMWPLTKSEVQEYIDRLEKLKSYFILAITSDNLEVSKQIYFEVRSLGKILKSQQEEYQEKATYERRRILSQWLTPYHSVEMHRKALEAHQPGTGQWFLSGPFKQWIQGELRQNLWLLGRPGVGKTSLISAAIDKLQRQTSHGEEDIHLAHFYCSFTDQLSQDPKNILGSLIAQICNAKPSLWDVIDDRYQLHQSKGLGSSKRLELSSLQQILADVSTSFRRMYLFVDAPNESSESALILSALWDLALDNSGVSVMISSTEEVILEPWSLGDENISTVSMGSKETHQDIYDYVDANLKHDNRLRHLPAGLKEDIKGSLVNKSDGVFRWVQCQLEALVDKKTPRGIRKALQNIPQSLEKTYCDILLRIPESDQVLAKEVLLWLTFAVRTLQLSELSEAVVVEADNTTIDDEDRLLHPTDLLRICRSLISFNPSTNHVTLAHSSVQAYLTSSEIKESPAGHFFLDSSSAQSLLMQKCLTYLSFDDFRFGYSERREELSELSARWPLLDYSVGSWPVHARTLATAGIEPDPPLRRILLRFFATAREPRNGNFGAWIQQYLPEEDLRIVKSPPLYFAARFGLLSVVNMILAVEGTANLESVGGRRDSTPFHIASAYGHNTVVRVLLVNGANPRAVNAGLRTGLLTAAENGEAEIVQMLIAAGADLNHRTRGRTALYLSIVNFEKECVRLLIEAGADTSDVDGAGTNAEDLQEVVNQIMPDAIPGQVRYPKEPDPRSGTNPSARGELSTEQDKRLRRELTKRLRIFSRKRMSHKRMPKEKWVGRTDPEPPTDLEGSSSSKSEPGEPRPVSIDTEYPMVPYDALPFAAQSPE